MYKSTTFVALRLLISPLYSERVTGVQEQRVYYIGLPYVIQDKLTSDSVRVQDKEFAFTKMITCGLCGSGITADEKFKKLKDGTTNRYVYYSCTKFKDKNCPCGYVREEDLIEQLANVLDTVSLDEIGMKDKIRAEIEAHNEFQESVLGQKSTKVKVREVDIRNYAKHILRKRPIYEKRELLGCLRSKLILKEKKLLITPTLPL